MSIDNLLNSFNEFQTVDLRRDRRTAYNKVWLVRKFLTQLVRPINTVTSDDIRAYLKGLNGSSPATYKNTLAALKVFFRDFLVMPQVVASFRFPQMPFKPKKIPTKEELRAFYESLDSLRDKALFLLYATTGLRRGEILSLKLENIDFSNRMITPSIHEGRTKQSWLSFYNEEAERALKEYSANKKPSVSQRLFPLSTTDDRGLWKGAKEKTHLEMTPQRLREWFCNETAKLGVSDRYIDAFCGRVPKSVLARHYSDYSPEKLKEVYEKANLKVLHAR